MVSIDISSAIWGWTEIRKLQCEIVLAYNSRYVVAEYSCLLCSPICILESDIDGSSLGDLWTLAVVFLVNIHLAMDVIWWSWVSHASIWGSIIATCICVILIDIIPFLPGYWAIFDLASKGSFWICLLGIQIAAIVPRFTIKMFMQHCKTFRHSNSKRGREIWKCNGVKRSGNRNDLASEMTYFHQM